MRTGKIFTWMVLVSVLCLFLSPAKAENRKMTVVYAHHYEPFSWRDEEGRVKGILVDLLEEFLGRRMGIGLSHEIFPWARSQMMVRQSKRDAFFTIPNAERARYTVFSELPLFSSRFILYSGANNPLLEEVRTIGSLTDLRRRTHLMNAYYLGSGWHNTNLSGLRNVRKLTDPVKILELLKFNRADVYIEQEVLARYQIMESNMEKEIVEIPNVMDITAWHLCVGKKSPFVELLPRLNALMAKMEKDGTLEEVREAVFLRYR